MSLLVLVVTLNGRSRGFVDPHLLNLHLRRESMNLEAFAHEIWIFRGGGPADGDEGFIAVKSSSDTSSDSGMTTG